MAARRQNSSCDVCRRLKRKCAFRGDAGPGNTCSNCSHLGYECTFEFATSQIERRRRIRRLDSATTTKQSTCLPTRRATIQSSTAPSQEDSCWLDFTTLSDVNTEAFLDEPWSTGDSSIFTNTIAGWPLTNTITTSNTTQKQLSYASTTPTSASACTTLSISETYDPTPSLWSGSPMRLLNSSFSQSIIGAYLGEVYASVMKGLESRYLCHTCNPLAPTIRYCFDNIVSKSLEYSTTQEDCLESAGEIPTRVTLVGLARFLDHFGKFYGNRIDMKTKQEDETLLFDAQQAFALQWSLLLDSKERNSSSPFSSEQHHKWHNTDAAARLTTLWFKIKRQLLSNANPHLSFTSVLAMFLFQMTSAPGEPEDPRMEKDQILSKAVSDFLALKELVEDSFRTSLASTPKYRNLLASALKIFEWFAYLKESTAFLVTGKEFVFKNGLTYNSLGPTWSLDRQPTDADVPLICQRAAQYLARLTWELNTIKQIMDGDSHQPVDDSRISSLNDALVNSISIVEEFDSAFGQVFQYCIDNFLMLSEHSQLSSSQLILFWNLAVLSLVEHIHATTQKYDSLPSTASIQEKATIIEDSAIVSTVAIARHITNISSDHGDKAVSGSSVLKLPLISHHLNLAQMAAILQKAIEHIIQRHAFSNNLIEEVQGRNTAESWMPNIKPLLSCILDIGTTFAGSRIAQISLQRLTCMYGDVLMDAWMVDDAEGLFD